MDLLKLGSKGPEVVKLQQMLRLKADGVFGEVTLKRVIQYQLSNDLKPDGMVGAVTMQMLFVRPYGYEAIDEDTDQQEQFFETAYNQKIHKHYLPKGQYIEGPIHNEYIFLHHTAGWNSPYKTVDHWGRDSRGRVATEFVLGGQKITDNNADHDGVMVQAFPEGGQGWHLGKTGSGYMNRHSVGIELNNFGYLKDGLTYAGQKATPEQTCTLAEPFKGHLTWHNYSDKQLTELEKWLRYIGERDNIDIRIGLVQWIKKYGPTKAFEFQEDAYYGKVKGLLTHTNVRRGKFDCYPHPGLIDMLLSLK